MSVSIRFIKGLLYRFSVVFPVPRNAKEEELAEVWLSVLKDFSEEEVLAVAKSLIRTLKRFPYPSDFFEILSAERDEATEKSNADFAVAIELQSLSTK